MNCKKLIGIFCALSLVAQSALPVYAAFAGPEDIGPLRSRALDSYHEGRYEEAAQLYRKIVAVKPKDIEALKDLMWVLWKDERFTEAGKVGAQVLALRKDDSEAQSIVDKAPTYALRAEANAHFHAGRFQEADKIYRRMVEQDPKNPSLLKDWMWSLWETENYEDARMAASRILAIDKGDVEAKSMLEKAPIASLRAHAIESYRAGQYQEAVDSYRRLLAHSPKNASILKDIYWCLWQMARYKEVIVVARQLTEINPGDAEAWNMLGRAQVADEQLEEGLRSYKKSLALNPKQPDTRRVVGRLHVDLREFDNAINVLSDLEQRDPSIRTIYPQLAKAQYFKGYYDQSAKNWAKAMELFPENDNYKIHEARSLYFDGKITLALEKFKKIAASSSPMKWMAIDFIVDDALSHQDAQTAIDFLESNLSGTILPADEPRLLKLATIYLDYRMPKSALRTLDRYLKINPTSVPALLLKADMLSEIGEKHRAARTYKLALKLNPYSIMAYSGLANVLLGLGHSGKAYRTFLKALALDPTDPSLILQKSHFLSDGGHKKEGEKVLTDWLNANPDRQVVPVLLYHGLTPFDRDPMLAYPVHVKAAVFEDHIRALKAEGYTPVTSEQVVAWYKKTGTLPKKPVLITFDDGRLDSFRYGDSILQKYGFKATMFVPIANIEGHMPPSYVSWNQIVQYQKSGRWEFQSHGDMAHTRVTIDPQGRQGLFLVNRQWLEKENRYETIREWKKRLIADHESTKQKISHALGKVPQSYAYPEGTYGQIDVVNSAEAVPVNLEVMRKSFQAAYHQDQVGINVRSRDPIYLARVEPHPDWSGNDLVRHLQDKNPYVMAYRRLLWQATWNDRPLQADKYLKYLKESGASQVVLLGEEGRIRSALDDSPGARVAIDRARSLGKDRDNEKLSRMVQLQGRPVWSPAYTFTEDSKHRRSSVFEQTLRPFPASRVNLGIDYMYGSYRENGVPDLTRNGAGLNIKAKMSTFQMLTARGMWNWFPDRIPTKDTYSASLALDSRWSDGFQTRLDGGRALYDTARALVNGITEDYADLYALWRQDGPWQVSAKLQGAQLSDDNRRYGLEAGFSRTLFFDLRGVYKYTFDHMDDISVNYYSPQQLHQHQLGLECAPTFRWFQPSISYMPGLGKERNTDTVFIQDVQAAILFRLGMRTTLQPFYSYVKTPTYWRNSYNVVLTHRF